ncbi:MAG TPA: WD40 repeat domain-containing protein [Aggregatilineaceae bacterium]|nr:WD40 repeat domain-containing protein [Aggregatilineaceae bacterium]
MKKKHLKPRTQPFIFTGLWITIWLLGFLGAFQETSLIAAQAEPGAISTIAWKPDGSQLAVGYSDGTLEIRDGQSGTLEQTLVGHTSYITALAWHPTANQLLSGAEGEIFLWDLSTGVSFDLRDSYSTLTTIVRGVSWSADGSQIFASEGSYFLTWDVQTLPPQFQSEQRNQHPIYSFVWNHNRSRVATISLGFVTLRDAGTFSEPEGTIDKGGIGAIAWSPDGNQLVTGDWVGSIKIWDVSSSDFQLERELQPALYDTAEYPQTNIQALQFNAAGTEVYSVAGDGTFVRWDADSGEVLATTHLTAPIYEAVFSPDGTRLAYGGESGVLELVPVHPLLEAEAGAVSAIAWKPDGSPQPTNY